MAAPELLSPDWMLIGSEQTATGGRFDLLALAPDASLVLIELKKGRTPREVVAQALDYATWVEGLEADEIADIYKRFQPQGDLAEDFARKFEREPDDDELNQRHQIVIVAAELDASSERIVHYLGERGIAINVLFFKVFQDGDHKLISRAWLLDPADSQENATGSKARKEPWNGEF